MSEIPSQTRTIIAVTRQIRTLFQRLRQIGDAVHADIGVTASLRALLEWLSENGSQTVPQIAAAKSVSRQHVQTVADELAGMGLVEFRANPGHKRSPFVALTAKGVRRFADMRARELAMFEDLARHLDAKAAAAALKFLQELGVRLEQSQGNSNHEDIGN